MAHPYGNPAGYGGGYYTADTAAAAAAAAHHQAAAAGEFFSYLFYLFSFLFHLGGLSNIYPLGAGGIETSRFYYF